MPNIRKAMMGAAGAGGGSELYVWGRNNSGQLGDGTTTNTNSPNQLGDAGEWAFITTGAYHSVAIKPNGTLWIWGRNDHGQLGDGTTTNISSPTQLGTDTDWAEAACGQYQCTFAVKTTGALFSWGRNHSGQLMQGTATSVSSPVQVGALTDWVRVRGGNGGSLGLKTDGTLWGCGSRAINGQALVPGTGIISSPAQIGSLTTWVDFTAGATIALGRTSDGKLWAWGQAYFGGLGNSTTSPDINSPVQVGTDTDWNGLATSAQGCFASRTDGTMWSWGMGTYGRTGQGITTNLSSPTQIGSLTDWGAMLPSVVNTMSPVHTIKADGTLWAWGRGNTGGLGNGTVTSISSPVQIGSDTDWVQVNTAGQMALGLRGG